MEGIDHPDDAIQNAGDHNTGRGIMMKTLFAALLAAISLPVAAQAQNYTMRNVIKGVRESSLTYTAVYSNSYGACTGGQQTAPITKCTRSDGVVVANSQCPQQMTNRTCTSYVCDSFTPNGHVSGSFATVGTNVTSAATAATLCQNYASANGRAGWCLHETVNQRNVYYVYAPTQTYSATYYNQNIAQCRAQ